MDPASLVEKISSYGILGLVAALALYVAYKKDKDLQAEKDARIDDAKKGLQLALDLQAKVSGSIDKLSDILEEVKRLPLGGRQ